MIVVGIDPDSEKHGVAVYRGVVLSELASMDLVNLRHWIDRQEGEIMFSIENVLAKNGLYARNAHANARIAQNIALKLGRCQQAQAELMRELDHREIPYQLIKPTKGNWADDNRTFQRITKWAGRSNADTRSAAYMGFLALKVRK